MGPRLTASDRFAEWIDSGTDDDAWERLRSRWWSTRKIHRVTHRRKIQLILEQLGRPGDLIEFCRGASVDGICGVMAAHQGWNVVLVTPSARHKRALELFADRYPPKGELRFQAGSVENIPDLDSSVFDVAVGLHVLEHAGSTGDALDRIRDVRARVYVFAVPTCLSLVSAVRLGGGDPYRWEGARSLSALVRGAIRVVAAACRGKVAVSEVVREGPITTAHRWFFPREFVRLAEQRGYDLVSTVPDALLLPWFERASVWLASCRAPYKWSLIEWAGFGTHFTFVQTPESDWSRS